MDIKTIFSFYNNFLKCSLELFEIYFYNEVMVIFLCCLYVMGKKGWDGNRVELKEVNIIVCIYYFWVNLWRMKYLVRGWMFYIVIR